MPTRQPLLQNHHKTLSKLIRNTTHKDKFTETLQTLQKYILVTATSQTALRKPLEL
jgi:uracil phosphoribosyltransferase